ncbi:LacI family DNA-binding transcriptional regulator [Microbacterium sp. H1-D42]|uniref:LacI family DNA-binding transcriptional regulator n=1 Tax=Microbacterium sp. H1-D42 TaxID=2925844 RepID=UPI001F53A14F|nr:LacI family DNA-binding transcriptional regulator [Microbacterium sp. H1-D42]UNK70548.1 LacI family transcriptional regulator [Microbacterium sp. H1-D42]
MTAAPEHPSRASIKDVARLAGVSAQTVSRVANGYVHVSDALRERVLASMQELGYRPNSAARNLKSGRFHSIGLVTFNITALGNQRTLGAVAEAATRAGYTTTLIPVSDPTGGNLAGAFGRLQEQAVDGIILLMSAKINSPHDLALTDGVPLVVVDSDPTSQYTLVDTDQEQGARLAMQHLFDLGHRRIAHVAGPDDSFSARHRAEAYSRFMREHDLEAPEILRGDWSAASGRAAGESLLGGDHPPTAVFVANDEMALGLLSAAHRRGLSVPAQLSVVGFDDSPDGAGFWPSLTSVHQNFAAVGQRATAILLAMIDGDPIPENPLIPTSLVVRDSTAAPAAR